MVLLILILKLDNLLDFFSALSSSSYAVFDSGYKYTYDRFNNKFRYIPTNGDIAGLTCRTGINAYPWFSPAGQQRGILNNAVKLAYNPDKAQRDLLYPQRVNSVITQPGLGTLLFGDKTGLGYASAFDRINVRRLFLQLSKHLRKQQKHNSLNSMMRLQEQTSVTLLNLIFGIFKQREEFMDS